MPSGLRHRHRSLTLAADVELVRWSALPEISAEEIATAWTPKDSLGTLRESLDGALFYFNPEGVDIALVREHLTRLERVGIDANFGRSSRLARRSKRP